jgi:flagellar biosynthesis GTPase FlhF
MPAEVYAAAHSAPLRAVAHLDGADQSSIKDLESEVYAARDVHGDDRVKLRRKLGRARSSMTETSYRRALELARDSVLLTIEECLEGGQAMEWEPLPRPEFTLASIEAAVAEQERAEKLRASYQNTERERAEQERAGQEPAEQAPEEQAHAEQAAVDQHRAPDVAEQQLAEQEAVEQRLAEQQPVEQPAAEQERREPVVAEEARADQEPAGQAEPEPSGTSRRAS